MIAGNLKPKTPGQWLKLALIPALSVGLLVALWTQPRSEAAAVETTSVTVQNPGESGATIPAPATQSRSAQPVWRKARLEDVIVFNPFEPEPVDRTEETAETEASGGNAAVVRGAGKSRPHLVASGKLQAIFVDTQGAAAILDSQIIRVGDTLPSGGRVVEITVEGIKLEGP